MCDGRFLTLARLLTQLHPVRPPPHHRGVRHALGSIPTSPVVIPFFPKKTKGARAGCGAYLWG
jgi:hypothetical protein